MKRPGTLAAAAPGQDSSGTYWQYSYGTDSVTTTRSTAFRNMKLF